MEIIMENIDTIPIQYKKGLMRFMGMEVFVDPRVFIPRPETELLVRTVSDLCYARTYESCSILDVGTGSGIIPLGLVKLNKNCHVVSIDVSDDALYVAEKNIGLSEYRGKVKLIKSDMFENLYQEYEGHFDVIVSNPPYVSENDYEKLDAWVKAEPFQALYAGVDGMDYLNILAEKSGIFLKSGGFLAVEIGYNQSEKVKELFKKTGFTGIRSYVDFNDYERVIVGWKNG